MQSIVVPFPLPVNEYFLNVREGVDWGLPLPAPYGYAVWVLFPFSVKEYILNVREGVDPGLPLAAQY